MEIKMRFSSLVDRKTSIFVVLTVAVCGAWLPALASEMISGADIKRKIQSFLAARDFVGEPAISETRLFPNCASDIRVAPMFDSLKTLELSCAEPGGFKIAIRTNAIRVSKNIEARAGRYADGLGSGFLPEKDKIFEGNIFLVLSRSVQKGEILTEDDVRLKKASTKKFLGYFTKTSDVIGRKLKKTLSVNQVLLSRHLEIDWDIRKGQKIIMQSNTGPVTVENSGIAINNAQIGELIKAENQQSGKIVEGVVVSRKKIRILTK